MEESTVPTLHLRYSTDPAPFEIPTVDVNLSTPVDLGPGSVLSKKDLLRGLLCSLAVYMDNGAAENLFKRSQQEFPKFDQFRQVHMSVDHVSDWKYKYLVAYAEEAIFVAFRGTDSLVDMADNLTITKSPSRHGGKVHEGFLKRSEAFLGPNIKLDVLRRLYPGRRIIVCGHSQGGAVAHMVLLRYFSEGDYKFTREELDPPDSLFSIAFGAPHVCDRLAAGIINKNEHMRWRFINFVNQADPVPRFLHNLPSTVMAALKEAPTFFTKSDAILNQLGGFVGQVISGRATGQNPDYGGMAMQVGGTIVAHSWKDYIDERSSAVRDNAFSSKVVQGGKLSEFHPVGQYVFLTRRRPVDVTDEWGPWKHNIEHGQSREMIELRISEYCKQGLREVLENHTLLSYKTALIQTSFLDISPRLGNTSVDYNAGHLRELPVVSTPSPVISSAHLDTSTSPHQLRIKGENLLFLYEPIRVDMDDSEGWKLNFSESMIDTQLVLKRRPGISGSVFNNRRANVVPSVTIKTAFGSATKHFLVKQEPVKSEETQNMLRAVVQVLALKASPPMRMEGSREVLEQLDHILECAIQQNLPENSTYSLASLFNEICRANADSNISKHIIDATRMIENVFTFLLEGRFQSIDPSLAESYSSSSSATPSSSTWGQYLWARTKVTLLECRTVVRTQAVSIFKGSALGAVFMTAPAIAASSFAPMAAGMALGFLVGAGVTVLRRLTTQPALSPEKTSLSVSEKYLEWLELAIEEASKWRSRAQGPPLGDPVCPREVAAYEKKLVENVEACPEFKKMVEHSYCNDPNSCNNQACHVKELKSPKFGAASPNLSPKQLLQRINIVVTTHGLYKKVAGENFVTVVGAEDAGKSTFIKEVLKKFGPGNAEMPETGVNSHTKDVRPYHVTHKVCMVDFPGGNGIGDHADRWQQCSLLPGSAILFLDFKDDLKQEQKQMYEQMKKSLQKTPIVVFNKVDERFTPEPDGEYTKEYFEEKRKRAATQLECYPRDVYYMSVLPNAFQTEERRKMMRERGVLDLETFADKVLGLHRSWIEYFYS